jgi:hypothetical protein
MVVCGNSNEGQWWLFGLVIFATVIQIPVSFRFMLPVSRGNFGHET